MNIENIYHCIMDANVLLDSLMINYSKISQNSAIKNKFEAEVFKGSLDYKYNFNSFSDNLKTIVTTSHVIAEIQGLLKSRKFLYGNMLTHFWQISSKYLKNKNLDEQLIKFLSISDNMNYSEFIFEIGFIDTGLIKLAENLKLPIITNDGRTLFKYARETGLEVYLLKESLSYRM